MNGSVTFGESTPYLADRNLGDGSRVDLLVLYHFLYGDIMTASEMPVVIEWLDWNKFLWRKA